jgi:hypothetical protein
MAIRKAKTFQIQCTIDEDITNWKIRVSLKDANGNEVKLATANSGGSDDQIQKTQVGATSIFLINFASGSTDGFKDEAELEIEVDTGLTINGQPDIQPLYKETIYLEDSNINWTTP